MDGNFIHQGEAGRNPHLYESSAVKSAGNVGNITES